jgi:hypothetical protein
MNFDRIAVELQIENGLGPVVASKTRGTNPIGAESYIPV